uniref:Delta-like protein n=1 Tax=Macrostomum lignano TaxID=282301 RepID=A0A1I8JPU3_9PLAT
RKGDLHIRAARKKILAKAMKYCLPCILHIQNSIHLPPTSAKFLPSLTPIGPPEPPRFISMLRRGGLLSFSGHFARSLPPLSLPATETEPISLAAAAARLPPGPNDSCALCLLTTCTDLIRRQHYESKRCENLRIDPKAWTRSSPTLAGLLIARRVMREKNYLPTRGTGQCTDGHWTASGWEFGYRFRCRLGFYGNSCQKQCRSRDDMLGHYSCSATGEIQCLPGYSGARCTTPICQPACVHGTCNRTEPVQCSSAVATEHHQPAGVRSCPPGYGGLFCDIGEPARPRGLTCAVASTTKHPRAERRPVQEPGGPAGYNYTCECPPGFTGLSLRTRNSRLRTALGRLLEWRVCVMFCPKLFERRSLALPISRPDEAGDKERSEEFGSHSDDVLIRQGVNGSSATRIRRHRQAAARARRRSEELQLPLGFLRQPLPVQTTQPALTGPAAIAADCRNLPDGGGFSCSCHPGWAGRRALARRTSTTARRITAQPT